jgi:tRNA1Val (adenine37-N6)-methyltransferase
MGSRQFRDFTKAGLLVDDSQDEATRQELETHLGEPVSCDALSGDFRMFQLKNGHRFSTDDVIVAWYGTSFAPRLGRILELGSGMGTVGMVAAWRLPHAQFVTLEAQEKSYALAQANLKRNGLTDRFEARFGDLRDATKLEDAGLFDLILTSPPYFPPGSGVLGDHSQKIDCRFEMRGDVRDYLAAGARHCAPGGVLVTVFPHPQRDRLLAACEETGWSCIRRRAVIPREGEAPLLDLFLLGRTQDLPASFVSGGGYEEAPLLIRDRAGKPSREYQAVKLSFGFPPW